MVKSEVRPKAGKILIYLIVLLPVMLFSLACEESGPQEAQVSRDVLLADYGYTGKMAHKFDRVFNVKLSRDREILKIEIAEGKFADGEGKLSFQAIIKQNTGSQRCYFHHGTLGYEKNEKDIWIMYQYNTKKRLPMKKCPK